MRGIQAMLLAAFAGLVGLGLWNARQWLLPAGVLTTIRPAPAEGKKETAGRLGKSDAKGRISGRRKNALALAVADDLSVSKIDVEIPAWHPKFPTPDDLTVGATGVQIRTKYGEPTARITEMRAGHVLERYYYFNGDRTQLTVATLESGVLVSAENMSR